MGRGQVGPEILRIDEGAPAIDVGDVAPVLGIQVRAGLDQDHAPAWILRKAGRQHAAGGSAAHDQVVGRHSRILGRHRSGFARF
jgi:hypothetical protein